MTPEPQALEPQPSANLANPANPADPFIPVEASLRDVAAYYTRLGFTAFGGPAAHIALMQQDLVEKRRWLSQQRFLDTLGATQLVPGPNSTEMVIHVGYIKRGVPGMLVAGLCFILPAFFITVVIAYFYVALGTLPQTAAVFYGIQPVIVAIILMAAYKLGLAACRTATMIGLALLGLLLTLFTPINTVWVIVGGGVLGVLLALVQRGRGSLAVWLLPLGAFGGGVAPALHDALQRIMPQSTVDNVVAPLWELGWFFLVVGATLMGSGYVLVSYMQAGLIPPGWLTEQQVLDAIAVGQMTPGPVFTTAAFVGYINQAQTAAGHDVGAGLIGAAVAAFAIFFPSFIIVLLLSPWIERIRDSVVASSFLDGVNAVVVGSIVATSFTLLISTSLNLANPVLPVGVGAAHLDLFALLLFGAAGVVLVRLPKLNNVWLILTGAVIGVSVGAIAGF
ncbi:MAG: chromate efflux transporter [Chloroflexaceae bacterium]|nr:chromate efflux transporter [Chloroflexaceae bacterium]